MATDSEHAFCALLERLHGLWKVAPLRPPLDEQLLAISDFAADLRKLGPGHRRVQPSPAGSISGSVAVVVSLC